MSKNIVLLSDGTGNSSAKPFKTNIWRMYQAIDIDDFPANGGPVQVVHYGDGVGTGTALKPLAMLGLAFGFGVAKNVRDLYRFLCRNYQDGDNIYLFGFSRGAFTVRVLGGLITRIGLVQSSSEHELGLLVRRAYAEYKRDVVRRSGATRRSFLGRLLVGNHTRADHHVERVRQSLKTIVPQIRFIGVWDTVDAYGMPIDELKVAIDKYVWPMTLADRKLSSNVQRACQALSLDDERPTFRPVLWDERGQESSRLTQVWFSGVHANVGGGYPNDGLAFKTLQWMMDEAAACGLRLLPDHRQECDQRADAQGAQYDSRSGLAGYYRYGPRNVAELCNDQEHGVFVAEPLIHRAVMQRLESWEVGYAPVSMPPSYRVVGRAHGGAGAPLVGPVLASIGRIETPADVDVREQRMGLAADSIFKRRVTYLATVWLSILLATMPLLDWINDHTGHVFGRILQSSAFAVRWSTLAANEVPEFLPAWTNIWVTSFAHHPEIFLVSAGLLCWLFFGKSRQLQDQISGRAEYAWEPLFATVRSRRQPAAPQAGWSDHLARFVRTSKWLWGAYHFITDGVVPFVLGVAGAIITFPALMVSHMWVRRQ